MNGFSDRPFYQGSLTGIRTFGTDQHHYLCAPIRGVRFRFEPGENEAVCDAMGLSGRSLNTPLKQALSHHQVGSLYCTCGYYAYFNPKPSMSHTYWTIPAIISGYGTCTVGKEGFRAGKAKLLALVRPHPARYDARFPAINKFAHKIFGRFSSDAHGSIAGLSLSFGAVFFVPLALRMFSAFGLVALPVFLVPLACVAIFMLAVLANRQHLNDAYLHFEDTVAKYPGVPVFNSIKEAVAAFPLTVPDTY